MSTVVLRFGSSVLRSESDLPAAVHAIYREWRAGHRVVAVVSALGHATDDLLKRAEQLGLPPRHEPLAALLATGEAAAAALLALALDRAGLPVTLLDPGQLGLFTQGDPLDAAPVAVDVPFLAAELARSIVVIPGRTGRDRRGRPTRLGLGGSDRTALFLARALGASCRPPGDVAPPASPRGPLRVALLGCGTVGGGVLARLLARPDLFQVTGVAVRSLGSARVPTVPRGLLCGDPAALLERPADVVVELLGGSDPARGLIARALAQGRHVVTANKALLASEVEELAGLAARNGVSLRFAAAVGGALPALEAVRRAVARGPLRSLAGVLNGTCNFVLDRCAAGDSYASAVALARAAGYAEADATLDLDGTDSAQKLSLLIHAAGGGSLPWERIPRRGIDSLADADLAGAARRGSLRGRTWRLVASAERTAAGWNARVQPLELPPDHPLARPSGAGNALVIERADGEVITLEARGAGRWPTTEAVMADLFDLCEEAGALSTETAAEPVAAGWRREGWQQEGAA
jgi:homoserine dehydrogenase